MASSVQSMWQTVILIQVPDIVHANFSHLNILENPVDNSKPDITGTNDEAQTASTRSSFDINSLMSMFDLLLALVRDRYSLPFDCSATSSGKKSKKAVFNFL